MDVKQWISAVSCCLAWIASLWSGPISADASPVSPPTMAYTRHRNLWIMSSAGEKQITNDKRVADPKWSFDGQWLAYQSEAKMGESTVHLLWVYNTKTQRERLLERMRDDQNTTHTAFIYSWAPTSNNLAVQSAHSLNVIDLTSPYSSQARRGHTALGVGRFAWLPDGTGFLVSSVAHLLPDGWTNSILYKIPLHANISGTPVRRLFTLPNRVRKGNDVHPIGTSTFEWSHDGRWIAFIAYPTAGISADSNLLCVLSADGKRFIPVGEMLRFSNWFAWAPSSDILGYVAGGGRFQTENKLFSVASAPDFSGRAVTSPGFADSSFTWNDDKTVTVSRQVESVGVSPPGTSALPALYRVTVKSGMSQQRITTPPEGFGDYHPQAVPQTDSLVWMRSDRDHTDLWVAHQDGTGAHPLVHDVDMGSFALYVHTETNSSTTSTRW